MSTVDWSKALIRCSCIGKIMTNGKGSVLTEKQAEYLKALEAKDSRTDKQSLDLADLIKKRDAPPALSDTCTSYLKEVYVKYRYNKEPIGGAGRSMYTIKGKTMEDESIMLLSRMDDREYTKNIERKENSWLTGECDIKADDENLKDIKSSWDFATLLAVMGTSLNSDYFWQGQGYMDLWGAKHYQVCYVLVNMPQEMIEREKMRIFNTMNPISEDSPDYVEAIRHIEFNMTFDEIPIQERIIRFSFDRDDELIEKIHQRVENCREWLANFEKIHLGLI